MLFNPKKEENNLCGLYDSKEFLELLYNGNYENGLIVSPANKLYKRCIFNDLRFKDGIMCEDDEICSKIYLNKYKIYLINKPLYTYVQNIKSISNTKFGEKNLIFLDILNERIKLFENNNLNDLVNKTILLYCNINIEYYFKIKKVEPKFVYKYYKKQFNKILWELIKLKDIEFKKKIRFIIYYMNPKIYGIFKDIIYR